MIVEWNFGGFAKDANWANFGRKNCPNPTIQFLIVTFVQKVE